MWKHLLIMVLILAGLIAWERGLAERTTRSREASVRIERFFDPQAVFTEDRPIAAFRLEQGDGNVHLYIHTEGVWRSATAFGTIALNDRIEALLPKLIEAEGVIQTRDPKAAREFGFDTPEMLTLSICGPDVMADPTGDVIFALDIGHSIPATGGSYVRRVGSHEVWAISIDLRPELDVDPERPLPPMLDPHIVPAAWPGFRPPGVERIVVELPDEPPLELQRHDRVLTDEEAAAGAPAWEWSVKKGDHEYEGHPFQIFSYGGFLTRAPYVGILGPRPPEQFGFDRPRGRITLRSAHGMHLQLVIGRAAPRGGVPVFNSFSRNVFEVDPAIVEMMLPDMDMLLAEHLGNPWEVFIRQRER